jgi:hypothetical protein
MTIKLGELLIREKLITPEQLDEALKKHVIYGIKLGSSLVEMGYVDEDRLAQLLSEKLGVPRVGRKEVLGADKEAIGKLTGEFAAKYRVIPFRIDRNRLSIAISDPTNFKAIEEIGFITGCVITTYIAPDVLISRALARFYHLSRAVVSYHQVAPHFKKAKEDQEPQTVTFPMRSNSGELLNVTVPAEFEGFGSLPDLPEETVDDITSESNYRINKNQERYTLDQLSIDFAAASNREDVADVFIRYLGQEFTYCAIFVVHANTAVGWRGMSLGNRLQGFEKLKIQFNKPSVLQEVVQSRNYIRDILQENPCNSRILFALKVPPSRELLVMPVIMMDEVVAVVLVSVDRDSFRWRMMELGKLVRKMSLAFEKIIIKQKILMT